jgi:uncharacterized protein DUF4190
MTEEMGSGPAGTTPPPPQYSPDGKWWWTGTEWVPASAPMPAAGFGTPPRRTTNGFAIAALVLGILWLGGLGAVFALAFGLVALKQIKRSGGTQSGDGLALAGAILGGVGILGAIALWTVVATQGHTLIDRGQTALVKTDLRQASKAEDKYLKSNGSYTVYLSELARYGYEPPPFDSINILNATTTSYCLAGIGGNNDYWYYDNVRGLTQTPCS